jgi:hypothetical protein
MIITLDTLIKSIKEVSQHIESRMECYVWNLEMFGVVEEKIASIGYVLVKKEVQIDVGETSRMI